MGRRRSGGASFSIWFGASDMISHSILPGMHLPSTADHGSRLHDKQHLGAALEHPQLDQQRLLGLLGSGLSRSTGSIVLRPPFGSVFARVTR